MLTQTVRVPGLLDGAIFLHHLIAQGLGQFQTDGQTDRQAYFLDDSSTLSIINILTSFAIGVTHFYNTLLMVNSNECLKTEFIGYASVPQNNLPDYIN